MRRGVCDFARGTILPKAPARGPCVPPPVKPGTVTRISRSIAACRPMAVRSIVLRGNAGRSAMATSAVANPSRSGLSVSRAIVLSGSSSRRRLARSKRPPSAPCSAGCQAPGPSFVARVMQAIDLHGVQIRLVDLIPGPQRPELVVLHEETGAEDVECVGVARVDRERRAREIGGVGPALLRESDAAQFGSGRASPGQASRTSPRKSVARSMPVARIAASARSSRLSHSDGGAVAHRR